MLIGGQAVLLHGEPRLTQDIDLTLGVSPEALPTVLAACEKVGLEPLPDDVVAFVNDTFVLPATAEHGIRVVHLLEHPVRKAGDREGRAST
jgi:hypothetical protein